MYHDLPDILASRLNFDVVSFRGNTRQEMIWIGLISLLLTAFVLGLLAKMLLGMFLIGLGLSFPIAIPVGWSIATVLQKLKDGKPKGYVKQRMLLWMDQQGIKSSPFVRHTGHWQVRR